MTPTTLYIDNRSLRHRLTRDIVKRYPCVPQKIIKDTKSFIKEFYKNPDSISQGKHSFFLTINKGSFLDACPGTKNYLCCGYQILHPSSQCSMDCSYCILQAYFNNPLITFFTNTRELFTELDQKLDRTPTKRWRIGTGEFTDSLVFDHLTGLSTQLIPYFIKKSNAILELKTKTNEIGNLLRFDPQHKIVIGWSLNSSRIVTQEERGATSIISRLKAARRCEKQGYKIAFHFDPIIHYPGWKEDYQQTIDRIFTHVHPHSIAWISLGCFRFIPTLKEIIEERFPRSTIPYHEFTKGMDGKMRYPKPLRIHIYQEMYRMLTVHNSSLFIYLCMESAEVWKRSFGYTPERFGGLSKGLDNRVFPTILH